MVEKVTRLTFPGELRPAALFKAWLLDHLQSHLDALKTAEKCLGPILPEALGLATRTLSCSHLPRVQELPSQMHRQGSQTRRHPGPSSQGPRRGDGGGRGSAGAPPPPRGQGPGDGGRRDTELGGGGGGGGGGRLPSWQRGGGGVGGPRRPAPPASCGRPARRGSRGAARP